MHLQLPQLDPTPDLLHGGSMVTGQAACTPLALDVLKASHALGAGGSYLMASDGLALSNCLERAWEHLRLNGGDQYLPDIISLEDVAHEWLTFKTSLIWRIQNNQYSPAYVDVIDLPKDALSVRPLARFALEDRLVYEACLLAIAPTIDAVIPNEVYSYRWSKLKQRLYSPKGRWVRMQRRARRIHKQAPGDLLLRTDISAFYEYIDWEILNGELRKLDPPVWALGLLEIFLSEFNNSSHAWGLPQGPDSSGVLANLYLLPLDNLLRHQQLKHLRYSDDLMIFGSTWTELRGILTRINHMCRSRHLTLSSAKTKIVPACDVPMEFENTSKDAVRYGIDIESPDSADNLHHYFDRAAEEANIRDIRFSLNQLARLADDWAVTWLLATLPVLPHLADDAINYLKKFRAMGPEIDIKISAMLANGDFAPYPPVERRVINYLVLEKVTEQKAMDACWSILYDFNKSAIVREFAARYVGRFCGPGDSGRLREMYQREPSDHVRRALLIACYEAGDCPRGFLDATGRFNTPLGRTARYLQAGPSVIPCPTMEVVW